MQENGNIYLQNAVDDLLNDFRGRLPEGLRELASAEGIGALGIDKLLSEIISLITGSAPSVLAFFLMLIGGGMLASLASLALDKISRQASSAVGVVLSLAILAALYPVADAALDALAALTELFGALIPVVGAIPLLAGGEATGAVASVGMQITLWIMSILSGTLLPPLTVAMLATAALGELGGASNVGRGFGNAFSRLVGIITAVVSGITALQTFISASADSAKIRLARYAASDMIPVVGNTLSGALSTLSGGLAYASGVIGAGSVAAIVTIATAPLVTLLLYRLAFTVAEAVVGGFGGGVSHIPGMAKALDALISVYVLTMIVYIFDIILLVSGGARILG